MFAKVAEEGSYAAASRALGVSVPTVSRAVARLEERLGARLFNRTSRQLSLTEFGQGMVEQASALYRQAEAMESEAQELSLQPRGLVRLAVPMAFGLRWVAPLLPELLALYPELELDLHLSTRPSTWSPMASMRPCASPPCPTHRWWHGASVRSASTWWPHRPTLPAMASPRTRASWLATPA